MTEVVPKSGSSMARVANHARELNLEIGLRSMDQSTRTAAEAAAACGCEVAQIVKSMIFENVDTDAFVLLLVSGAHKVDLAYLSKTYGMQLKRADARRVRAETGFAIGGVAPIGHLKPIDIFIDDTLLDYAVVWAAAGRPDAVFSVNPRELCGATNARRIKMHT